MTLLNFPNRERAFERGKAVLQPNKPYLSTEEVAQLFGLSDRTITALAAAWHESSGAEGIPAFKIGRSWRFERKDIEAFINSKKAPSQQPKRPAATA
jgi:excisionase family DNA binding protein